MKKIFTLAFSILVGSQLFAASEFFLKINSGGNYSVSLNNQTITSSTSIFRFFDLYPGIYNLTIYENGFNGRMIFDKPVTITDEFRIVTELDRNYRLNTITKIPFVQSSWYIDNLLLNQNNQQTCGTPNPYCPIPPHTNGGIHGNYGYGFGNQGWNNGNTYNNNFPNCGGTYGYGFGNLMDDAGLQTLIQTMKNLNFDDKKVAVAKTALKDRVIKTAQVHKLLEEITFENNKLDLAKYCYDKTSDKYNYYTLYNDFAFNSYSSQLDKYINSR